MIISAPLFPLSLMRLNIFETLFNTVIITTNAYLSYYKFIYAFSLKLIAIMELPGAGVLSESSFVVETVSLLGWSDIPM